MLVTSRTPAWGRTATTVRLDVLDRDESVAFLRRRAASSDTATLTGLAEALGDLPLALEQAAAYMDETQTTPAAYLALFREHGAELLTLGEPLNTEQTVATTWQVAMDRVAGTPAAQELLNLCAFLAPDAIPRGLLQDQAKVLPEPLRGAIARPLAYNQAVGSLGRYSLVTMTADTLTVHRLVQTVVRADLSFEGQQQWAGAAVRLVNMAFPSSGSDVATWPIRALLLPHVLTVVDFAQTFSVEPEATALLLNKTASYLLSRGQHRQALSMSEQMLAGLGRVLGDDHPRTLTAMNNLALARRALGDLQGARELYEQALTAQRRVLGNDHPHTLIAMNNLGGTRRALGDLQGALELYEQTLAARRRVLGDDHPDTLTSMGCLAETRRALGDLQRARELYEQTLTARRRVLGDDHPHTVISRNHLAAVRRELGGL